MLSQIGQWLLARIRAEFAREAARARQNNKMLAEPMPRSRDFVSELKRLLGEDDADHGRRVDASGVRGDDQHR
jgi:hypothetical protein